LHTEASDLVDHSHATRLGVADAESPERITMQSVGAIDHGVRIRGDAAQHAQWVTRHIFSNEDFMPYVERMLAERPDPSDAYILLKRFRLLIFTKLC